MRQQQSGIVLLTGFHPATLDDRCRIVALLRLNRLPTEDITALKLRHFLVCGSNEAELAGCVGIEVFDWAGLVRSLAVATLHRSRGLGSTALIEIEALARSAGLRQLYLLTNTAAEFFERRGYSPVDRAAVPKAIAACSEFTSLCPADATCMTKGLTSEPEPQT